ncbi:unnamed protein product [Linum trigynum]|uniref:DUF7788 domain-containing protein n=1 Tax=Linum trigynum TaxID=586398 RepID=A0AAV2D9S8_9ROSI
MALLVLEDSSDPWRGKAFTSSNPPKWLKVEGDDFSSKSEYLWEKNSGEDLNFLKVYHRMLQVGITENLGNEKMEKMVFFFSSCGEESGFDQERWEKDYKEACKGFRNRGYKSVLEIVYWDLRSSN